MAVFGHVGLGIKITGKAYVGPICLSGETKGRATIMTLPSNLKNYIVYSSDPMSYPLPYGLISPSISISGAPTDVPVSIQADPAFRW
jgi:hypothetical protein